MDPRKLVLIAANPRSGASNRAELIESLRHHLEEAGWEPLVYTDLSEFTERASEAHSQGRLRAVISAGGDGTATAVASRIAPEIPICLFPVGTENLLAKYLNMTADPAAATAAIGELRVVRFDAGTANGKLFLILVGVGFDAEVVRRVHLGRVGHVQRWQYAVEIFKSMWFYRFPRLTIRAHNTNRQTHVTEWDAGWLFVANLPCYALKLCIAPMASGSDGEFDICTFRRGGVWQGLRYLYTLCRKKHLKHADFRTERATHIQISAPEPAHFQIDGDYGGLLPVQIEILRGRLCLVLPAEQSSTPQ